MPSRTVVGDGFFEVHKTQPRIARRLGKRESSITKETNDTKKKDGRGRRAAVGYLDFLWDIEAEEREGVGGDCGLGWRGDLLQDGTCGRNGVESMSAALTGRNQWHTKQSLRQCLPSTSRYSTITSGRNSRRRLIPASVNPEILIHLSSSISQIKTTAASVICEP